MEVCTFTLMAVVSAPPRWGLPTDNLVSMDTSPPKPRWAPTEGTPAPATPSAPPPRTFLDQSESDAPQKRTATGSGGAEGGEGERETKGKGRGRYRCDLCKYYEQGQCYYGDQCTYAHGAEQLVDGGARARPREQVNDHDWLRAKKEAPGQEGIEFNVVWKRWCQNAGTKNMEEKSQWIEAIKSFRKGYESGEISQGPGVSTVNAQGKGQGSGVLSSAKKGVKGAADLAWLKTMKDMEGAEGEEFRRTWKAWCATNNVQAMEKEQYAEAVGEFRQLHQSSAASSLTPRVESQTSPPLVGSAGAVKADTRASATPGYRTRLCTHHANGKCWRNDQCTFAHGEEELRRYSRQVGALTPGRGDGQTSCSLKDSSRAPKTESKEVTAAVEAASSGTAQSREREFSSIWESWYAVHGDRSTKLESVAEGWLKKGPSPWLQQTAAQARKKLAAAAREGALQASLEVDPSTGSDWWRFAERGLVVLETALAERAEASVGGLFEGSAAELRDWCCGVPCLAVAYQLGELVGDNGKASGTLVRSATSMLAVCGELDEASGVEKTRAVATRSQRALIDFVSLVGTATLTSLNV